MLLGQARGKVGDIVFSRNNGRQVIKARSEEVKNPQTTAQVLQRILLNTVSQAYSKMLAICDHSFEGVKTGQDTMSAFMKRNLNQLRGRVVTIKNQTGSLAGIYAVTPIGSKTLSLNPYIMATGTLPPAVVSEISGDDAATSVAVLEIPGVTESLTYENVIAGLGLNRGDQLTFITLNYDTNQGITFNFARIILDPTNADGTPALIATPIISDGAVVAASERNTGVFARLSEAEGKLSFSVSGGQVVGACCIVSRQADNGNWLRSNAVMKLIDNVEDFEQYALLDAIDLFYSGGIDFESSYFLNNAERNTQSGSAVTVEIPRLSSLTAGGENVYGSTATVNVATGTSVAVAGQINNFNADQACKVVFSQGTLQVDGFYTQQAGHVVVNASSANFNGSASFSDGDYNTYFIAGGYVRQSLGKVHSSTQPSDGGGGEG